MNCAPRNFNRCLCALIATGMVAAFATQSFAAEPVPAKNIILMISDGLGMNGWEASSYYLYDQTNPDWHANLPYGTQNGFTMYGCTHGMKNADGSVQGYDPTVAWNNTGWGDKAGNDIKYDQSEDEWYEGQNYLTYTDSAAAATALYSGVKTYKGAIGVDIDQNPVTSFFETAAATGKATGAISSVEMSHATPAAVDAHNTSRNNYAAIANEMIYSSGLDVIMGCGPGHSSEKYVGGPTTLADIQDADGANGFTYIHTPAEFQAMANNPTPPSKVIGLADTTYTLGDEYLPGTNNESVVPTLKTMTEAALNVLSQNTSGFAMMVEGGAVDWQNHDNALQNMLTEQEDFDNSVQAVINWIEDSSNGSSWDDTLLIVTADHETGGIWGPGSFTDNDGNGFFDDSGVYSATDSNGDPVTWDASDVWNNQNNVANNGQGILPGVQYTSGGHTNQLVPLFTKGAGSALFAGLTDGTDSTAQTFWGLPSADLVDNTDVYTVMMEGSGVPEPATLTLLGLGGLAILRRRRSA